MERCVIGFWREYGGGDDRGAFVVAVGGREGRGNTRRSGFSAVVRPFCPTLRCKSISTNDTNTDKVTKVPHLSTMNRNHLLTLAQTTLIVCVVFPVSCVIIE